MLTVRKLLGLLNPEIGLPAGLFPFPTVGYQHFPGLSPPQESWRTSKLGQPSMADCVGAPGRGGWEGWRRVPPPSLPVGVCSLLSLWVSPPDLWNEEVQEKAWCCQLASLKQTLRGS